MEDLEKQETEPVKRKGRGPAKNDPFKNLRKRLDAELEGARKALEAIEQATDEAWLQDAQSLVIQSKEELDALFDGDGLEALQDLFTPLASVYAACDSALQARLGGDPIPLPVGFSFEVKEIGKVPAQFFNGQGLDDALILRYIQAKNGDCSIPGIEVIRG